MPKTLMLMRHGQYTPNETLLNTTGQQQVDDVTTQLADDGLVPDVIIHSPTPRAAETARRVHAIFNSVCGKDILLQVCPGLADKVESHPSDISDIIDALDNTIETALVVSHMPNIFSLLKEMNGKAAAPGHAQTYVLEGITPGWSDFRGRETGKYFPETLSR